MTARIITMVLDSLGQYSFSPESCAHEYTYATDGTVSTDTAFDVDGCSIYVKTYTSDGKGKVLSESGWVRQ